MRRLSVEIERRSVEIFGVDDIAVMMTTDGYSDKLAPQNASDPIKPRRALNP